MRGRSCAFISVLILTVSGFSAGSFCGGYLSEISLLSWDWSECSRAGRRGCGYYWRTWQCWCLLEGGWALRWRECDRSCSGDRWDIDILSSSCLLIIRPPVRLVFLFKHRSFCGGHMLLLLRWRRRFQYCWRWWRQGLIGRRHRRKGSCCQRGCRRSLRLRLRLRMSGLLTRRRVLSTVIISSLSLFSATCLKRQLRVARLGRLIHRLFHRCRHGDRDGDRGGDRDRY